MAFIVRDSEVAEQETFEIYAVSFNWYLLRFIIERVKEIKAIFLFVYRMQGGRMG